MIPSDEMDAQCPHYPRKRTRFSAVVMSALCQKQTSCVVQKKCLAGSEPGKSIAIAKRQLVDVDVTLAFRGVSPRVNGVWFVESSR